MRRLRWLYRRLREYYGIWVHGVYASTGEPIPRCYRCGKPIKELHPCEVGEKDFHKKCYDIYLIMTGRTSGF